MKIISGLYKGRNIEGYNINGTRPTMDRVKMSLFSMLQYYIEDSTILDLFSGSGNLGLEALSEGASYAYLVDNNIKCCNIIKRNIDKFGIKNAKVICSDYKKVLKSINTKFDIIFLDPPYRTDYVRESIKLIDEYDLLNNNGIIVCESDSLDKIIYTNNYIEIKNKKYGDKYIVLLKKNL